jgi:hypothetical protein
MRPIHQPIEIRKKLMDSVFLLQIQENQNYLVEVSTKKVLKAVPELNKTPSDFSVAMTN